MNEKTKCPYCGGEIEQGVKKCLHCGEWLKDKPISATEKVAQKKLSNKKWGCFMVLAVLASPFFIYFSLANNQSNNPSQASTPATSNATTPAVNPLFDVPALVGKNIDQTRTALGKPADSSPEPTKQQVAMGVNEWDNSFGPADKPLLVTFNPSSRKVIDFFLGTDDPSGKTKDKSRLLQLANVKEGVTNYIVEYIASISDPASFTGIKIIPR